MRALELIAKEYPLLNGKQLLQIQQDEKKQDKLEHELKYKKTILQVKDLKENGGYFRAVHATGQMAYYRLFNFKVTDNGDVYCSAESVVLFKDHTNNNISVERRTQTLQRIKNYPVELMTRITKANWGKINKYLDVMPSNFWFKELQQFQ